VAASWVTVVEEADGGPSTSEKNGVVLRRAVIIPALRLG
jgi:hypothetical protein